MAILAILPAASADDFKPSAASSFYIDLDSMDNRSSVWRMDDLGDANALRAKVTVKRVSDVAKQPGFGFEFRFEGQAIQITFKILAETETIAARLCSGSLQPDGSMPICNVTHLMASPRVNEPFYVFVQRSGADTFLVRLSQVDRLDGAFPPNGVQIYTDGQVPPIKSVEISASSANVVFEDVRIGLEPAWSN